MGFLRFVNRAFEKVKNKSKDDGKDINSDAPPQNKKKFNIPLWIFGGSFGCLGFIFVSSFILIISVLIFLKIIDIKSDSSSSSGSSISYNDSCDFENTMVTVMDYNNTTVLATVSLEDYVIGCAVFEIGLLMVHILL